MPGENYDQEIFQQTNSYSNGSTSTYGANTNSFGDGSQYVDNDDAWSEDWDDNSSVSTVQQVNVFNFYCM